MSVVLPTAGCNFIYLPQICDACDHAAELDSEVQLFRGVEQHTVVMMAAAAA
jgi:hypothetical protein